MKTFLEGLFAYDKLVNDKMIDTIIDNSSKVDERTLKLMSHIVVVQQVWNARMLQKSIVVDTWCLPDLSTIKQDNNNNYNESLSIIADKDLAEVFTYHSLKGDEYKNTYADVLYHIINHNNYHCAQINTRLRDHGIEPVICDYLFYKR